MSGYAEALNTAEAEIAQLRAQLAALRAENAELGIEARRLSGLLQLTDRESRTGDWRVVLDYDNYQDGALIIDGDGEILGRCYDVEKAPNDQFRAALDAALAKHAPAPVPEGQPDLSRVAQAPGSTPQTDHVPEGQRNSAPLLLCDEVRQCMLCDWKGTDAIVLPDRITCPVCGEDMTLSAEWARNPMRGWFYGEHGGVIRVLSFHRYDPPDYEPRDATLRLRADDPRPMGVRFSGMEYLSCQRAYASLPLGVWIVNKHQAEPIHRLP